MSYWKKADELEEFWKNSFRETTVGDCFYIMGKKVTFPVCASLAIPHQKPQLKQKKQSK